MNACDRPVEPLLTAELDELAGQADTELGRHVRDCPHCSATARKIMAANVALNASLAEARVLHSDSLIARARLREKTAVAGRSWWGTRVPPAQPAWRWALPAAAVGTLAIAAILLWVVGSEEARPGSDEVASTGFARTVEPVHVDAPGYAIAVIPTANPDLTIIWFSKEGDDDHQVDDIRDGPIAVGSPNGL